MTSFSLPPRHVPSSRPHILVVDDDEPAARLLAHMLGPEYDVTVATDGVDGLASARERLPDLIITDVGMPRLDGFSMVRELRAATSTHHVPVIFMTGHTRPSEVVEGIQAGARHYVTKPVDVDALTEKVRHCLQHGETAVKRTTSRP